jgi:membrane protease YdiL (CAAX protease family)
LVIFVNKKSIGSDTLEIHENSKTFTTYLTPALVSFGAGILLLVLQVIVSFPIVGILFNLPEFGDPLYDPIWNLLILFGGQITGTIVVLLWLIPWLRVKYIEQFPLTANASITIIFIICLTWALLIAKSVVLLIFIDIFQLETPSGGLEQVLVLSEEIISPVTILIFFAPLVLGAPLYEELVYRRILIPLLEKNGMSSFGAVIASSLFFTLLHAPTDLIYGNLTGTVLHISSVLILGFVFGLIYIKTRNVIYPMVIHGVVNGISAIPTILVEDTALTFAYEIFLLIIVVIVGLIYLVYLFLKYRRKYTSIKRQFMLGMKSVRNKGFYGYLIISLGLLSIHTLISVFLVEFSTLVISPALLILIWFIIKGNLIVEDQITDELQNSI